MTPWCPIWYQDAIAHTLPKCSVELQTQLGQIGVGGKSFRDPGSRKLWTWSGHQSEMQAPKNFFFLSLSVILSWNLTHVWYEPIASCLAYFTWKTLMCWLTEAAGHLPSCARVGGTATGSDSLLATQIQLHFLLELGDNRHVLASEL